MSAKLYNVSIFFDLHGVSCPGVWLCPKGKILVKISLFGVSEVTKQVTPVFPLRFNERFHFQKTFRSTQTLSDLHARLHNSLVKMQLIQHPPATTEMVVLAVFCSTLTGILYPCPNIKSPETTADVDLLFCPCKIFPGIIAPKAEVSTKIIIKKSMETARGAKMNPSLVSSQNCKSRMGKNDKIIRQKGVCHTPFNLHCKCFLSSKTKDKRCAELMGSVVAREMPKRSRSATPFTQEDDDTVKNKQWFDNNTKKSAKGSMKSKSHEKINKGILLEDEQTKKSDDVNQFHKNNQLERHKDSERRKLCSCCINDPKVQFRNFTTQTAIEAENRATTPPSPKKPANELENHSTSKCELCNCSLCIKYENYFIHRALKHNRGNLTSKMPEVSDSNESPVIPLNVNPIKCYCFKDKKDFNTEAELKKNNVLFEANNDDTGRCYVCNCPLLQSTDAKKDSSEEASDDSLDLERCTVCKCPLVRSGKNNKTMPEFKSLPPREQFYNDLEKIIKQCRNSSRSHLVNNSIMIWINIMVIW